MANPSNESILNRLKALENLYPVLSNRVDNALSNIANDQLPEKIKLEILESAGLDKLFREYIDSSPTALEMKALSKANHQLKQNNKIGQRNDQIIQQSNTFEKFGVNHKLDELEEVVYNQGREIDSLKKELKDSIIRQSQKNAHLDIAQARTVGTIGCVLTYLKSIGLTDELLMEIAKKGIQDLESIGLQKKQELVVPPVPEKKVSSDKKISVYRKDIENQGEYVIDRPHDFKRSAFRNSVKLYGISKRALADLLGVSVNKPDQIKGRIQDWIKEDFPNKPIYIKVRLVKYGEKGEDKVLFFPPSESFGFLQIEPKNWQPWRSDVRQAVLNGTATIID